MKAGKSTHGEDTFDETSLCYPRNIKYEFGRPRLLDDENRGDVRPSPSELVDAYDVVLEAHFREGRGKEAPIVFITTEGTLTISRHKSLGDDDRETKSCIAKEGEARQLRGEMELAPRYGSNLHRCTFTIPEKWECERLENVSKNSVAQFFLNLIDIDAPETGNCVSAIGRLSVIMECAAVTCCTNGHPTGPEPSTIYEPTNIVCTHATERARELLRDFVSSNKHWLYKYTILPPETVGRIRTFLSPPPFFVFRAGKDLWIEIHWFDDLKTYSAWYIARRRNDAL